MQDVVVIDLVRGANVAVVPQVGSLQVRVLLSWQGSEALDNEVDVIALLLNADSRVASETDFVFYNSPASGDGAVRLLERRRVGARSGDELLIDLAAVDSGVESVVVAAAMSAGTFQDLRGLELAVATQEGDPALRVDLGAATTERAYVAGEFYRRQGEWKFRAVGQGWESGLAALATEYGVDVQSSASSAENSSSAEDPQLHPRQDSRIDDVEKYRRLVDATIEQLPDQRGAKTRALETKIERAAARAVGLRSLAVTPDGRRMHKESRLAEAAARTELIEERVAGLANLLAQLISQDAAVQPHMFVARPAFPTFNPGPLAHPEPPPDPNRYAVAEPTGMGKVLQRAKYEAARAEAARVYHDHCSQHAEREQQRQQRLAAANAAHQQHLNDLDAQYWREVAELKPIWQDAANGSASAITAFNQLLLAHMTARPGYPADFPRHFRIAYTPESRQLTVEFDLPSATIVPSEKSYRYVVSTDTISPVARSSSDAKRLYADVVSQTALAVIDVLFRGDVHNAFDTLVFNGMVDAIDPATGLAIRPCLVTTRATREVFEQLDVRNVDPAACLRHLGASVSKSPAELAPVRPVLEFSMVDPRFISESDVLSSLDERPNLMDLTPAEFESLITNLFAKMGLETRQTQASRDGGVDCVAYDPRPIFGGKVVIQAKRYKNTVGVSAVRDLFGTMQNEGASKGILVTTSGYGQASHQFAANKPLELIDGANLLYLLAEHAGVEARIVPPEDWSDPNPDM